MRDCDLHVWSSFILKTTKMTGRTFERIDDL